MLNEESVMEQREASVTEAEAVKRERAAFVAGANRCHQEFHDGMSVLKGAEKIAAKEYPLPKVSRPRVVKDRDGFSYRVVGGKLEFLSDCGAAWAELRDDAMIIPAGDVREIASLFDSPTELCDAE